MYSRIRDIGYNPLSCIVIVWLSRRKLEPPPYVPFALCCCEDSCKQDSSLSLGFTSWYQMLVCGKQFKQHSKIHDILVANLLASIGAQVEDDDLLPMTLNGLDKKYRQFWTSIGV